MKVVCYNRSVMIHPGSKDVAGDSDVLNSTYRPLTTLTTVLDARVNCTEDEVLEGEVVDKDKHALLYIVVVLLFYSLGIIIAIVMYLKREKEEIVEEKAYEDYMNFRADPDKWARYFRVQKMIYHLNKVERARDKRVEFECIEGMRLASQVCESETVSEGSNHGVSHTFKGGRYKQCASMQLIPSPSLKLAKHPKRHSLPNVKIELKSFAQDV